VTEGRVARSKKKAVDTEGSAPTIGLEQRLSAAADALRNNMDAAEYKHVVLGLIFLKYISDAFEAKHPQLLAQRKEGADPEDRDEYGGANIFWVPKEARWEHLKANAPQPTIGTLVDDAILSGLELVHRIRRRQFKFGPGRWAFWSLKKQYDTALT
jgi:type I restriction enzyme M protein